jgi:hypothetical protein
MKAARIVATLVFAVFLLLLWVIEGQALYVIASILCSINAELIYMNED